MVGPDLQVRFPTDLTDEEYVSQRAWNDATAPDCRWCEPDKCKLAPHGFYARVKPPGTLIRRFRCKRNGRTVSVLPDCFNARRPGSLDELEAAAREAERAASWNAAVEKLRPPGQGSPASAERWLKRRVQWVSGVLVAVKGLHPERFTGVEPTLARATPPAPPGRTARPLRPLTGARTARPRLSRPAGAAALTLLTPLPERRLQQLLLALPQARILLLQLPHPPANCAICRRASASCRSAARHCPQRSFARACMLRQYCAACFASTNATASAGTRSRRQSKPGAHTNPPCASGCPPNCIFARLA